MPSAKFSFDGLVHQRFGLPLYRSKVILAAFDSWVLPRPLSQWRLRPIHAGLPVVLCPRTETLPFGEVASDGLLKRSLSENDFLGPSLLHSL